MPDSYPNFRALATERKRSSVHTERRLARALLAALDYTEAVEAVHNFMQKPVGHKDVWKIEKEHLYGIAANTCGELAALEAEAGRD